MAKYYLYILLSFFIILNGVTFFEKNIKKNILKEEHLKYKLKKQQLFNSHKVDIESILEKQNKIFVENRKLFFKKSRKETIVFSELQESIQLLMKGLGGKILHLNSGMAIDSELYKKYPLSLSLHLIPEDLDNFFENLYKSKKYLFVDSIHINVNSKKEFLNLKITVIGYQLK